MLLFNNGFAKYVVAADVFTAAFDTVSTSVAVLVAVSVLVRFISALLDEK